MSTGSDRLSRELGLSKLQGSARALAEEAVRIKARLDALDKWITGKGPEDWFELGRQFGSEVTILINAPLAEARQQALALRAVVAELAKMQEEIKPAAVPSKADELAKKRADRLAQQG